MLIRNGNSQESMDSVVCEEENLRWKGFGKRQVLDRE